MKKRPSITWTRYVVIAIGALALLAWLFVRREQPAAESLSFQEAIEEIGPCATSVGTPNENVQNIYDAVFGNRDFADVGFTIHYLCKDADEGVISYIMARPKLEQISSQYLGCNGECDEILFGMVRYEDQKIIKSFHALSAHQFGIFTSFTGAEAHCAIDHVTGDRDLSDAKLWFYCGNERDGGLTDWFIYTFAKDDLLHVQELNPSSPGGQLAVKYQYNQRGYHILEQADIGSFIYQDDADFRAQIQ